MSLKMASAKSHPYCLCLKWILDFLARRHNAHYIIQDKLYITQSSYNTMNQNTVLDHSKRLEKNTRGKSRLAELWPGSWWNVKCISIEIRYVRQTNISLRAYLTVGIKTEILIGVSGHQNILEPNSAYMHHWTGSFVQDMAWRRPSVDWLPIGPLKTNSKIWIEKQKHSL